jgi:hypothetical protein
MTVALRAAQPAVARRPVRRGREGHSNFAMTLRMTDEPPELTIQPK